MRAKWSPLNQASLLIFCISRVLLVGAYYSYGGFDPEDPHDLKDDSMHPPFTREVLTKEGWLHHRAKPKYEHLFGIEDDKLTVAETQRRIVQLNKNRESVANLDVVVIAQYHHTEGISASFRRLELDAVLQTNLENPFISEIHLLQEDDTWSLEDFTTYTNHEKVTLFPLHQRLGVGDAIRYANENLLGKIVILTNLDIYFDLSLSNLQTMLEEGDTNKVYALSRRRTVRRREGKFVKADHRNDRDQCEDYLGSHDVFIFTPPLPERLIEDVPFYLGVPGVENVFMWQMLQQNMTVLNPCSLIHANHIHNKREKYKIIDRVDEGMRAYVNPGMKL